MGMNINNKLSRPLQYSIIAAGVVVSVIIIYLFVQLYNSYTWREETGKLARAKLAGEVNKIQKVILSAEQIPQNLAYILEFSKPTKEHMDFMLKTMVENNDEVFGSCIAFEPYAFNKDTRNFAPYTYIKDGKTVSVNPSDTTYNYFSMDWYLVPKHLQKPVWIEPYYDEGSGGGNIIMATYSVPFYSFDGTRESFRGIVTVDISLDWLSSIVSSVKINNTGIPLLVSENGNIISSPDKKWPYNESLFSLADEKNLPALREVGRNLQQGKSGFVKIGKFYPGTDYWVYYMQIPANKWGILLILPEN